MSALISRAPDIRLLHNRFMDSEYLNELLLAAAAEVVRHRRTHLGLTQGELHEVSGISQSAISRTERGAGTVSLLLGLSIALKFRPSQLFRNIERAAQVSNLHLVRKSHCVFCGDAVPPDEPVGRCAGREALNVHLGTGGAA